MYRQTNGPERENRPAERVKAPSPEDTVRSLQRRVGNSALARAFAGETEPTTTVPDVLDTSGHQMPGSLRREMEARLGADFSGVRLHTDAAAQRSAAEIGARAYTSHPHIVLGAGGTDPHTIAHELAHYKQQAAGLVAGTPGPDGLSFSHPHDSFERQAETDATDSLRGPVPDPSNADAAVQRAVTGGDALRPIQRMQSARQAAEAREAELFGVPDAVPESLQKIAERIAALVRGHESKEMYEGPADSAGLDADQINDYRSGKRPDLDLEHAQEMVGLLEQIDTVRASDAAADQWCAANAQWLETRHQYSANAIKQANRKLRDYGYFLMYSYGQMWDSIREYTPGVGTEGSYSGWFENFSRQNMSELNNDPAVVRESGVTPPGATTPWVDAVRTRVIESLRKCVLRHYTSVDRVRNALAGDPSEAALKSKMELGKEGIRGAHNTASFDEIALKSDGFVYFFIEQKAQSFRESRFGGDAPARVTVPIELLERNNGWVMLNDFLDVEFPTLRADASGNLLAYKRDPDPQLTEKAQKFDPGRIEDGQHRYASVPEKSPEGRVMGSVYGISELKSATAAQRVAADRIVALATQLQALSGTEQKPMLDLIKGIREAQAQLQAEVDQQKLANRQNERGQALSDSRNFPHGVRKFAPPAYEDQEYGELRYYRDAGQAQAAPEVADAKLESATQNLLVGADVIPGLAQRAVVEIARIHRNNPQVGNRLIGLSGDELVDVLLRKFLRPQAMMPDRVSFTADQVEYLDPE